MTQPYHYRAVQLARSAAILVAIGLIGCSNAVGDKDSENSKSSQAASHSKPAPSEPVEDKTTIDSANKAAATVANPQASGSSSRAADSTQQFPQATENTAEFVSARTAEKLAQQQQTLDPSKDGWNSEALSNATNSQYKQLAKWLANSGGPTEAELAKFVATDFACGSLRPKEAESVYTDGAIEIQRGDLSSVEMEFKGTSGFAQAISELIEPLGGAEHPHIKFKQFKIRPGDDVIGTTAYFHAFAETEGGPVELNSTWDCQWRVVDGSRLLLTEVKVRDFEQATASIKQPTLFTDLTAAVLGGNPEYREQLLRNVPYWRKTLPANLNIQYHGHFGLAVGDVNGDELEDVYLCQPGGLPNRLYLQQTDGTVRESAANAGLDILNYTRGALLVDLDNDGDQDLVLTVVDQVTIFENDGKGVFTPRAEFTQIRGAYSISAADYDNDTDLDLYVCRHRSDGHDKGEFPVPYPYYDANNGGENFFLKNEGDWKFIDATEEVGLDVDNTRFSFASSWEDYDNDGDLDMYVANDFGRNTLYRNDGGKFVSASDLIGLDDMAFGMSVSWGDYNRDGLMDLYVGNMFSAAGNRITFQDQFRPDLPPEELEKYQRTARGNSLFQNRGDGTFEDVSTQSGVTQGRWSWASLFADINNDGWEDLLVTNGFVTGDTVDDL